MQYQQVYTGQINKSLMGVIGNKLHKGVGEVHEKETLDCFTKIRVQHHSKEKKKKVTLRYYTKSSDECADNSILSFVSPL